MSAETRQKMREMIDDLKRSGGVHSVDYERGRMRVNILSWAGLKVDTKEQVVKGFAMACAAPAAGEIRDVQILSDRNDTVLAEYDWWNGIRIHH